MSLRNVSFSYESLLRNAGPFTDPDYNYAAGREELETSHILVIGAGGLGCEILKDLALSGIRKISVIDMDTIELTNLNRQFLFREENVGKSKAIVASDVVKQRLQNGVKITPYFAKIQDFDDEFYMQFSMIICGLDSIEARRWINAELVHLAQDRDMVIPMIDGGTEGFQGSVKVIIPTYTACFECYMPLIPEKTTYPLCTLASTPRLPEHCIEWAHQLEWEKVFPGVKFDADDMQQVEQMYQLAKSRAEEFGIEGVTKTKTLGVVKNIIPAIASTNAIISAQCCNEAFKFLTGCNPSMKDSMFYNGENGVLCETDEYFRLPNCPVCGKRVEELLLDAESEAELTLEQLALRIKNEYALEKPVLMVNDREIYNFKYVEDSEADNDRKAVDVLAPTATTGTVPAVTITIVDKNVASTLEVTVKFCDST